MSKFSNEKLNFQELQDLLKSLKIPDEFFFNNIEQSPALDFWEMLDGDRMNGVTKQSINVILQAILTYDSNKTESNTFLRNDCSFPINIDMSNEKKQIGSYDEANFYSLQGFELGFLRKKYQAMIKKQRLSQRNPKKLPEKYAEDLIYTNEKSKNKTGFSRNKAILKSTTANIEKRKIVTNHENLSNKNLLFVQNYACRK